MITKKIIVRSLENLGYGQEMKARGNGYDERYGNSSETDTETLVRIKTNMKKMDLLRKLQDDRSGITEKLGLIENHDRDFRKSSAAYNMSAGGLWKDFNTEIL